MTDEQINIAIAEHCGWTRIEKWDDYWLGTPPQSNDHSIIPDYCNDLNVMHEVEVNHILIDGDLTSTYWHNLYEVTESTLLPFASTARQRATAFLKTIEGNQ